MILEGGRLWLFVSELNQVGVSTEYIYKKASESRKRNRPTWKTRKVNGVLQIEYDSLPDSTKEKLPTRQELLKNIAADRTEQKLDILQNACELLTELHERLCFIADYHFFLHKVNDRAKAEDLKVAAGWLRLLKNYRTPTETKLIGFESKAILRKAVVEQLLDNFKRNKAHLYGFKITNVAVLQRKELEFTKRYNEALEQNFNEPKIEAERLANQAALGTLIHENFANNNRRVIGRLNSVESERILLPGGKIDFSEWNAKTLVYLFMNPGQANKYDFENVYRRYLHECKKSNRQPEISISAVKDFLGSDEVKLFVKRERHGWAEFDKMLPHVYGKRPEYSLSKGGYDGFQVDFTSRIDGKQLMLTVVAVFDYMSEAITGFDVGLVEDGLMVRNMYRNHLNLTGGRSFLEIESDRFSGNLAADTKAIFESTCQHITQPTPNDPENKAANPKARFVERLIQELNRLTQNFPAWKGTNITSIDKNRKPNQDYRAGNYVEGYAESVQQIIELVNIYNNDTYNRKKSRIEVFRECMNPEAPVIPHESIALLLNQHTIVTVRNAKVQLEVNRRVYEYAFPEFDQYVHMMLKGYRVKVHYDETDMSSVDVFGDNEQYIATLGRLKRVSRAKAEQTDEDLKGLGLMTDARRKMTERITRKSLEVEASVYGLDISNLPIDDAIELIAGARETSEHRIEAEELFEEALSTPIAKQHAAYYQDRLIRANGESVPVSKKEAKSIEQQRRQMEREKFNRNKDNESFE